MTLDVDCICMLHSFKGMALYSSGTHKTPNHTLTADNTENSGILTPTTPAQSPRFIKPTADDLFYSLIATFASCGTPLPSTSTHCAGLWSMGQQSLESLFHCTALVPALPL